MRQDLSKNWEILQDVHDTCEQLGLPEHEEFMTLQGPQISEWEPLPELKQLQKYDQENHTELFATLSAYFSCGMDTAKTAAELYIHKNTVRYRIQQCQEILGMDMTDGEAVFSCMLSMKAMALGNSMGNTPGNREHL